MSEPLTDDQVRQRALDHVSYGWSPQPGSANGPVWTDEQRRIYQEEYDKRALEKRSGKELPPTLGTTLWRIAQECRHAV